MSDFRIRRRREGNGTVLILEGAIDSGEFAQLDKLVRAADGPLAIDFLHVREIPDRLVGELAKLQRR